MPKNTPTPMTPTDASRIQAATAKQNDGMVPKGSFAATAQSAAATNVNTGKVPAPSGGKK